MMTIGRLVYRVPNYLTKAGQGPLPHGRDRRPGERKRVWPDPRSRHARLKRGDRDSM
jgi:hypothetical protein